MKLTINNKQEDKLMGRTHIQATVVFENATPKKEEVLAAIAAQVKADAALGHLEKIEGVFGKREAHVDAYVYSSPEALQAFEVRQKKTKKQEEKKDE